MSTPHGILLVDKAEDRTSHDVVARARWLLGTKKVGHAGTLDPMATGLLVLGIGQGTRLLTYLVGLDKTYTATIRLGQAMTTDDREGEPLGQVRESSGTALTELEEALARLRGDIQQVPSTVSAIKVDGKRAYARARAGEEVELDARPVRISRFEVTGHRAEGPFLDIDAIVTCSSGTYVRALARDLGAALGLGGHLTALRRTEVGPFAVERGVPVPARGEGDDVHLPLAGLGQIAQQVMASVEVDEKAAADLGDGKQVPRSAALPETAMAASTAPDRRGGPPEEEQVVAALDSEGRLCALVRAAGERWRPQLVIPREARC